MGNRQSTRTQRQSLMREDSIFSEATWDFCEDIDSLDIIELQILSSRADCDRNGNACASERDGLPDNHDQRSVPVPGVYVMSSQQYSRWCRIFGTSPTGASRDTDHSERAGYGLKTSKWRLWMPYLMTRRGRSRSLHTHGNDSDNLGSSTERADSDCTEKRGRSSEASSPQAVPKVKDNAQVTDDLEYEGACSPPLSEVRTSWSSPLRRFVAASRTRHYSACSSDAYDSDHCPEQTDSWHRSRRHSEPSPRPPGHPDDSEDDLEAQLQWLTAMTDSIYSSAADSDLELAEEAILEDDDSYEDIDVPQTSPGVDEEHQQVTSSHGGDSSWEPRPYDLETELDWLCEPEWNNLEMELFWHVLRPHVESLLQPQHTAYLPEPCVPIRNMDAGDCKMLDKCLLHVQWHIWKGNYCQAVSDFRAARRHFRCGAQSHLIESDTRDDVESLRLIFQRKRPSRFRLWI